MQDIHKRSVTRLQLRYDRQHFPEDLIFQETGDRQKYQGRYVIRRPWKGATSCDVPQFRADVRKRQEREAQQLASLTGWDIEAIRVKIPFADSKLSVPERALVETTVGLSLSGLPDLDQFGFARGVQPCTQLVRALRRQRIPPGEDIAQGLTLGPVSHSGV